MNIYSDKAGRRGKSAFASAAGRIRARATAVPYAVICIFYWPRPQPNFSGGRFITAPTHSLHGVDSPVLLLDNTPHFRTLLPGR